MKKRKKVIALILALVLTVSIAPTGLIASAANVMLNVLVSPTLVFNDVYNFSNGLARVNRGTWENPNQAFVGETGNVVIDVPFDYARSFSDGLAAVSNSGGKHGFINTSGAVVIQPQFDWTRDFSEGLAAVQVDSQWGFINTSGAVVIQPQFNQTRNFSEGLAAVQVDSQWGFINTSGTVVIQPQFNGISDFSEGLAAVRVDSQWGFINTSGDIVIQPQFSQAGGFSEGLAAVQVGSQWGFINTSGTVVIQPQFDWVSRFSEGLAAMRVGIWGPAGTPPPQWGFINRSGDIVIQPQFSHAGDFHDGLATVSQDSRMGFINTAGNTVLPFEYEWVSRFYGGLAWISQGSRLGIVEIAGRWATMPEAAVTERFPDVRAGRWYTQYIGWAVANGITTGMPAGSNTFQPTVQLTRGMFVTFLWRMAGEPAVPLDPNTQFTDLSRDWYQDAVAWVFYNDITTGMPAGSNTFNPNANVTRQQMATFLHRFITFMELDSAVPAGGIPARYTDRGQVAAWANNAVSWAVYHEVMGVNTTTLNPNGDANRAEAVTMLFRVAEIFNLSAPA